MSAVDAVLTFHTNPHACGVCKFNQQLALRLGVPCLPWATGAACQTPLISVKPEEVTYWGFWAKRWPAYDVFLHGIPDIPQAWACVGEARTVYAANPVIARAVQARRPDVVAAFCPSTIQGTAHRGTINVLTFGMAHKIQTGHFVKLRTLLDATGEDYTVSVSCGIHEGSPWAESWTQTQALLGGIFGDQLRLLGFLADDALAKELRDCTAVALFYDPALRANNTTFWAALDARKPIVTNLDEHSPVVSHWPVCDVRELAEWPSRHRWIGEPLPSDPYSWDQLTALLGAGVAA